MSLYADDIIRFSSVLKIAYNFLNGSNYLRRKRTKERKKLISVAFGFPDLVFAADCIPVFPVRLESFEINMVLGALNSAKSVLGWDLTTKLLDFARWFDVLKIVDNTLNDVIKSTNKKYNDMYDLAENNAVPHDLCFGIKALYGMHISKSKDIDANLNFTIRCRNWKKFSESLKPIIPNQIWIDFPRSVREDDTQAIEIMVENMKANMANPNFWAEKEEILQKARDKVLKKRKKRQKTEE